MALGDAAGEEAALANVVVEMFQAPISAEITRRSRRIRTEKGGTGRMGERQKKREVKEGIDKRGKFTALFSPREE